MEGGRERKRERERERCYFQGFLGSFVGGRSSDSGTVLTTERCRPKPLQTSSTSSLRIEARSTPSSNSVVLFRCEGLSGCARAGFRLGVPDRDGFPVVRVGAPKGALQSLDMVSSLSFCGQWRLPYPLKPIWTQTDTHWKWNHTMFA